MKLIKLFLIVFLILSINGIVSATVITSSDTIQYSSDDAVSTTEGVYTKVKEIVMTDSYTGSWKINFDMRSNNDLETTTVYARIYKNGVAYGTEQTTVFFDFVTKTQTFTGISINSGDLIQIYARTSESPTYSSRVMNFRIMFDLPVYTYDPSGYIKDYLGNPIYNAHVNLSNLTWIDPCTSGCFSDTNGYWNTNIYSNGTYNYIVEKEGYEVKTGSQVFNISGTNYNFTMNRTEGLLHGIITTYKPGTGTIKIQGDVNKLAAEAKQFGIANGDRKTLTGTYVLSVDEISPYQKTAIISLYNEGNILYTENIDEGETISFKISESSVLINNMNIKATHIFTPCIPGECGEFGSLGSAQFVVSYSNDKKYAAILQFYIAAVIAQGFGGINTLFLAIANWGLFSTDASNINPVTFDAFQKMNGIGSMEIDGSLSDHINTFTMIATAEAVDLTTAGIIEIGFTDDGIDIPDSYTEKIYINEKKSYETNKLYNWQDYDLDNDKKIKVHFKFLASGGSFNLYEFYLNAWGASTSIPLPDANIRTGQYNTLSVEPNGNYTLTLPYGTYLINFYKDGYEHKNNTFIFNSSASNIAYNVMLNTSNQTFNETTEYINIAPDPSNIGTQIYAYYLTAHHTNPAMNILGWGGYEVRICNNVDEDTSCDIYRLNENTEAQLTLKNYPIGYYTAYLTGYMDGILDFSRDIIAQDNFTIISSIPSVHWGSPSYYMDSTMKLTINVPSGSQNVTIRNSSSIIYTQTYSAATTLYTYNLLSTGLKPGTYTATITGGNSESTILLNTSITGYNLSAPSSVKYGEFITVRYTSPQPSYLTIVDNFNVQVANEQVEKSGILNVNTRMLKNTTTSLKLLLIRDGDTKISILVTILAADKIPGIDQSSATAAMSSDWLWVALIVGGLFLVGMTEAGLAGGIVGSTIGMIITYGLNIVPLWALMLYAFAIILSLALFVGGKVTGKGGSGGD